MDFSLWSLAVPILLVLVFGWRVLFVLLAIIVGLVKMFDSAADDWRWQ